MGDLECGDLNIREINHPERKRTSNIFIIIKS